MQIPSVIFIEMAMEQLAHQDNDLIEAELKEFNSLGPWRKEKILAQLPAIWRSATADDAMAMGYLLGLETARVLLLMGTSNAVQAREDI